VPRNQAGKANASHPRRPTRTLRRDPYKRLDVRFREADFRKTPQSDRAPRDTSQKKLDLMRVPEISLHRVDLYFYPITTFFKNGFGETVIASTVHRRGALARQRRLNGGGRLAKKNFSPAEKKTVSDTICANLREVYFSPAPRVREKRTARNLAGGSIGCFRATSSAPKFSSRAMRAKKKRSAQHALQRRGETIEVGGGLRFGRADEQRFLELRIFFTEREAGDDVVLLRQPLDDLA